VVAKLSTDGSNWVTFKTWFIYAMAGHNIEGHFDGSEPFPTPPTFSTTDQNKWMAEDEAKHESHLKSIKTWILDVCPLFSTWMVRCPHLNAWKLSWFVALMGFGTMLT